MYLHISLTINNFSGFPPASFFITFSKFCLDHIYLKYHRLTGKGCLGFIAVSPWGFKCIYRLLFSLSRHSSTVPRVFAQDVMCNPSSYLGSLRLHSLIGDIVFIAAIVVVVFVPQVPAGRHLSFACHVVPFALVNLSIT